MPSVLGKLDHTSVPMTSPNVFSGWSSRLASNARDVLVNVDRTLTLPEVKVELVRRLREKKLGFQPVVNSATDRVPQVHAR